MKVICFIHAIIFFFKFTFCYLAITEVFVGKKVPDFLIDIFLQFKAAYNYLVLAITISFYSF